MIPFTFTNFLCKTGAASKGTPNDIANAEMHLLKDMLLERFGLDMSDKLSGTSNDEMSLTLAHFEKMESEDVASRKSNSCREIGEYSSEGKIRMAEARKMTDAFKKDVSRAIDDMFLPKEKGRLR